jgi:hypothetical protein
MRTKFRSPDGYRTSGSPGLPLSGRVRSAHVFEGLIIANAPPGASFAIGISTYEQIELYVPMTPMTARLRA